MKHTIDTSLVVTSRVHCSKNLADFDDKSICTVIFDEKTKLYATKNFENDLNIGEKEVRIMQCHQNIVKQCVQGRDDNKKTTFLR